MRLLRCAARFRRAQPAPTRSEAALGTWYPLIDMFNPERTDVGPQNAYWISGENDDGDIVATTAAPCADLLLARHHPQRRGRGNALRPRRGAALRHHHRGGGDDPRRCAQRRRHLGAPRLSQAAALAHPAAGDARLCRLSRWPIDWIIGYRDDPAGAERGRGRSTAPSISATASSTPTCRSASWYWPIPRARRRMTTWPAALAELSSPAAGMPSLSTTLAQEVTKISLRRGAPGQQPAARR